MRPFHYAFKVKDIDSTRKFYVDILNCEEGRSTDRWIDFDFFGNQLSAHVSSRIPELDYCGEVDGVSVPIPHFGCIVPLDIFEQLAERLETNDVHFLIKPIIRYKNQQAEQWTMFFTDFSDNPIEIKAFSNEEALFTKR
jgi:uncharacterized protein